MPVPATRAALILIGLACALSSTGCLFQLLEEQFAEIEALPTVSIRVDAPEWTGRPIVLVTMRPATQPGMPIVVEGERTLLEPSTVEVRMVPGSYMWAAYEDMSGDGRLQPGMEPVGVYDGLRPTVVAEGDDDPEIRLTIAAGLPDALEPIVDGEMTFDTSSIQHHEGTVTPLSDPHFQPPAGTLGIWQPLEFVKRYGAGIHMLQPYDPGKTPVLFIHGMGGSPVDFRVYIAALDADRYQAWVAHYPSGWRLQELAAYLDGILRGMQGRLGFERIVVVAHSVGGLIARSLTARRSLESSQPFISRLVLVASPLGGLESAEIGAELSPTSVPAWLDLGLSSEFITRLFDLPIPSCTEVTLLFAYGRSSVAGASDGTVPVASQLRYEAQLEADRQAGFDVTHAGILTDPFAVDYMRKVLDRSDTGLCQAVPRIPGSLPVAPSERAVRAPRAGDATEPGR